MIFAKILKAFIAGWSVKIGDSVDQLIEST